MVELKPPTTHDILTMNLHICLGTRARSAALERNAWHVHGAVRSDAVRCGTALCSAARWRAAFCGAERSGAARCGAEQGGAARSGAVRRSEEQRGAVWRGAVQRGAVLRSAAQCGVALYGAANDLFFTSQGPSYGTIVKAVGWLGLDLTCDLGKRALDRLFTRNVSQMPAHSSERADLRAIGVAALSGVMGALVADPEAGVQLAAEAVAPATTRTARQLAAAQAGVVENIVQSYRDAQLRGATEREKRQILSPLVPRGCPMSTAAARCNELMRSSVPRRVARKGYTRKQLAELGIGLSEREYRAVRLHACAFGAAASAEEDVHKPQRLDRRRLKDAIAFLYQSDNMQQVAYGSRDISFPDGTTQPVPDTLRVKCRETLFEQYARERQASNGKCWCGEKGKEGSYCYDGLSRTKFLEAADLAAKGDLKQLGALDGVAEFSGRVQFSRLRDIVKEVTQLCPATCGAMRQPLMARIDRVEVFIKRDLAAHLHANGADQCVEHCSQHAHADPKSQNDAQPTVCSVAHPLRCAECAELGALIEDVQVLLRAAEAALTAALPPAAEAEVGGAVEAGYSAGDYVTYTRVVGQLQLTRIRQLVPNGSTQNYEVDYGFEGGTRLASVEQLQPRRSEPRLEQLRQLRELASRSTTRLRHYYAHEVHYLHHHHLSPSFRSPQTPSPTLRRTPTPPMQLGPTLFTIHPIPL